MPADISGTISNPGFTQTGMGEASENERDESGILADQDQTTPDDLITRDENMGAPSNSLEALEDEPSDFMRGEVDVKEQMDRAADALDSSIRGLHTQADEDSPSGELEASFRDTPGGVDEVAMRTDEDLKIRARAGHPKRGPGSDQHH